MLAMFSLAALWGSTTEYALVAQSSPTARTALATNVTSTSATLNGFINPNGSETMAYFVSCSTPGSASYFNNTPEQNIGAGTNEVPVSHTLTGLTPGLLYDYQVMARVGNGYVWGSCTTFSTPAVPLPTQAPPATLGPPPSLPGAMGAPTVQTLPATNISQTGATLNGSVNANSLDTTVDFISCDPQGSASYFYHTSSQFLTGDQTQSVWSQLSGLNPGTTYRFAVRATNSAGTEVGSCLTFMTSGSGAGQTVPPLPGVIGAPTVQTLPATNIAQTSVRLNASVNPNSLSTSVGFISCDPTSSPGYFAPTSFQNVSGTLTVTMSQTISGLGPGVAHNYRVRATNTAGTVEGNCIMFVTSSTQATLPPITQLPVTASAPPMMTSAPRLPPAQPVNSPPKANAGSDKNVTAGSEVNFDGSASTDPDGNVLTYSWDFGDGQTGSEAKSVHKYDRQGEYAVSLTVSDGKMSDTAHITVFVQGKAGFQFDSNMLIMGGIAIIVLLVVIVIVAMSGRKKQPPRIYRSSR